MARQATGQVVERATARGTVYALRFRAYGERRYITLGTRDEGWTTARAETELQNVRADVRRGIWRPPAADVAPPEQRTVPTFHEFASEWFAAQKLEGAGTATGCPPRAPTTSNGGSRITCCRGSRRSASTR